MRFKSKGGRAKIKRFVSESPSNFATVFDQNQMNSTNMRHRFSANSSSEDIFDEDAMETDWTEDKSCIKCDKSGEVLFCSGSGCPLVVHQRCIPGAPQFDDTGKFLCPYCLCKQAISEVQRAKKKAYLAKKVLSKFIDTSMVGGHEPKEKVNGVRMKEQNRATTGEDGGSQDFENIPEVSGRFVEVAECEQRTESSDSRCIDTETVVEHLKCVEQRTENVVEPTIVEPITSYVEPGVTVEVGKSSKSSGLRKGAKPLSNTRFPNARRKKRQWMAEEEEMLKDFENSPEVPGRFVEVAECEQRTETSDSRGIDIETVVEHDKCVEQRTEKVVEPAIVEPITSYAEPGVNVEVGKSSKSSGLREGAKPLSNTRFPNARRKKRQWTAEEEEMLKEGVHKFSTATNKNVPWRKILEFGRHVFDATRNPVDLKDKWRNMWAKDPLSNYP